MSYAIKPPIVQAYDENIFHGAVITSTVAPSSSYLLSDLGAEHPSLRIIWGTGTVTLIWTLLSAKRGDILVIPMFNLVTGFATLTNNASTPMNRAIPFPPIATGRIPNTCVVDLTLTDNITTRTASIWSLVIASNPQNVRLGGAVLLYAPRTPLIDRGFLWDYNISIEGGGFESANESLTQYITSTETLRRIISLSTPATTRDADTLEANFKGNFGRGKPGLLWHDVDIQDAMFGHWQKLFKRQVTIRDKAVNINSLELVTVEWEEISKGAPLL